MIKQTRQKGIMQEAEEQGKDLMKLHEKQFKKEIGLENGYKPKIVRNFLK